ncbi:MAG: DUF2027 domain-containing protein [Muribaculaceae bacterium]|nr:DUF2027 domain-containing protein [Muribaculaceae bacterium]MDE6753980.1 DUF2027 domain-containing protein [Muribaculaceae bacterium]
MAKIGDTVRFLNSTGGGKITKIEGKIAYVDDDGFETPILLKELVVVLPAGHEPAQKGSRLMFDQEAFDEGKKQAPAPKPSKKEEELSKPQPALPVEETEYGDRLNIALAFEPSDVKNLDKSRFTAVIVNDSNYQLEFTFLRRAEEERGWTVVNGGTIPPNELLDIANLTHEELPKYDKIVFQCLAFKKDKIFSLQAPVSVMRKLDLTKFHKFHCFRPGVYFENAVIEIPLVKDGVAVKPLEVNAAVLTSALKGDKADKTSIEELTKKYNSDKNAGKKRKDNPADNPHKLLPLIEVDLHIGELTDTIVGMEPKDMLELQLDTVRKTMKAHSQRIGQKIVFIHGKGEGVLRKAVLELLRKEFPKAEIQDASFREYGFGASLITIN